MFFLISFVMMSLTSFAQEGHHGLDYGINLGYGFKVGTEGDDGRPLASLNVGKRFNEHFYVGGEFGVIISSLRTGKEETRYLPLLAVGRVYSNNSKVSPFTEGKVGFIFNTQADNGGQAHQIGFAISEGLAIKASNKFDIDLSAGYGHMFGLEHTGSKGCILLTAGFKCHF